MKQARRPVESRFCRRVLLLLFWSEGRGRGCIAEQELLLRCHGEHDAMHCRTDVRERTRAAAVARRTVFSSRALAFCAGSSSCARRARSLNTQLRSATLPATVTVRPPRRQTSSHLPLVFARFRSSYGLQRFTCGLVLAFATSWQHLQFAVRDLRELGFAIPDQNSDLQLQFLNSDARANEEDACFGVHCFCTPL